MSNHYYSVNSVQSGKCPAEVKCKHFRFMMHVIIVNVLSDYVLVPWLWPSLGLCTHMSMTMFSVMSTEVSYVPMFIYVLLYLSSSACVP